MKIKNKLTSLFIGVATMCTFNTQAQLLYCSQVASSTADDEIFNVTLGTLNNTSNCATTGGPGSILNRYSDYTNASPAVAAPILVVGQNYPMSITVGQCGGFAYSGICIVWIDYNQNGLFTDPGEQIYISTYGVFAIAGTVLTVPGGVTIPLTAVPGITRMRVSASETSVAFGPCAAITWGEVEDYNVFIGSGTPCAGTPASNSVVITPTSAICPNSAAGLSLLNTYTLGGMTYQWQYSNVSAVGPWTPIPSGTLASITSPTLNAPHYFSAIVTCTNSNNNITASSGTVLVQNTTTNTVPYFEGFENIPDVNKLPNCSWSASNLNGTCFTYTSVQANNRTPRTGQRFAAFGYTPAQNNHFWTNQIWMEAGVTYSANVYYKTEAIGYLTWQLSLLLNTGQTAVGSTVIATTGGPGSAVSPGYVLLSNTFTVGSTGFYNVGINGVSNGVCCANFMSWDDLEIMIPCQLNSVALGLTASSQTICQGQSVNLTATGADSYLWNNGSTSSNINVNPMLPTLYQVVGTNAVTGCTASLSQNIVVNPSPLVSVITSDSEICSGESSNLLAFGADSYAWSNSSSGSAISVSPNSNTSYTVIGTNTTGCSSSAMISITVHPLPVISVNSTANNNLACIGDQTTLDGLNAVSFQWSSSSSFLMGNPVNVSPNSTITYTVIGTDANGCKGSTTYVLNVVECVGINAISSTASGVKLYPNPNQGEFVIEINNMLVNAVEVSDITGRVLVNFSSNNEKINIDLSHFANGVYYVKITSNSQAEVIKIVKQ